MNFFNPTPVNYSTVGLSGLAQRTLTKGEVFLLAKAVADNLPLPPADVDNIAIFNLKSRTYIDDVLYTVSKHSYISADDFLVIYKLVNDLTLWRTSIAHNPPAILFSGNPNNVVDDVSCILKYVDVTYVCAVSDVVDNANYMYGLFRDVASNCKMGLK